MPLLSSLRGTARGYSTAAKATHVPRSRLQRYGRRAAVIGVVGGVIYVFDKEVNARALSRSLRTAWMGLICTIDYKINFVPSNGSQIDALHERVAARMKHTIDTNQGLYLKLGQALGLQAMLLPKPYREAFSHIFDRAPTVSYAEVEKVFRDDLGVGPKELFSDFTEQPLASASIAQVHKAKIMVPELDAQGRDTGRKREQVVAVKVQKPAIGKQMEWDLFSYRTLMWLSEKLFDMPMYFVASYVSEQMRLETSFLHEASNARKCAEHLAATPELAGDVYVPRVYGSAEGIKESNRVMVMEWVDGCKLNDVKQMQAWGIKPKDAMDITINTMSAMSFTWGFVHCDPHPGNILVRPHPTKKGKPQIILIDHGLYITLPKTFREQYCTLWRSLFVLDVPAIERIAGQWGIALDANMFASAILLRPFQVNKNKKDASGQPEVAKSDYERQLELKTRLKSMLENEQLIPRELIFLTRCQRMMQANNQTLGSPSPRINITAHWASKGYSRSLTTSRSIMDVGLSTWLRDRLNVLIFSITLGIVDISFWAAKLKQRFSSSQKGWEDELQQQFEKMAKDELGIEIDDTVFLG